MSEDDYYGISVDGEACGWCQISFGRRTPAKHAQAGAFSGVLYRCCECHIRLTNALSCKHGYRREIGSDVITNEAADVR